MKNIMDCEVQVLESSFVVPKEQTPQEGLWLSPLDLVQANKGHTLAVNLYSSSNNGATADDFFDVARVKEALARALVVFYPLAGRLGVDNNGRVEITCNGEGTLFVVARAAGLTVYDIKDDFKPSPELRRLFIPRIEPTSALLAIQVTFLKCGGVALGTAFHHVAVDASSVSHFFETWSAFSKHGDRAIVELPCHDRTLLRARSPPTVLPDVLSRFYPKLTFRGPSPSTGPTIVAKVLAISKSQVASLKRLCGGKTTSTFCAISALVWQCACIARRLPLDSEACVTFPANVRHKLMPPLPRRYFGNGLVRLGVTGKVRDIVSETLVSVAGRIKGAIDGTDGKLVRSAIDYYEMAVAERDSRPVKGTCLVETNLHITSWLGMPVYDADFGWGKPWVMLAEYNRSGFVQLMSDGPADDAGGRGVRVLMCMETANLKELERLLFEKLLPLDRPARCLM